MSLNKTNTQCLEEQGRKKCQFKRDTSDRKVIPNLPDLTKSNITVVIGKVELTLLMNPQKCRKM